MTAPETRAAGFYWIRLNDDAPQVAEWDPNYSPWLDAPHRPPTVEGSWAICGSELNVSPEECSVTVLSPRLTWEI